MAAWAPKPTAMPTSNNRDGSTLPCRYAKANTKLVVAMAPATAPSGKNNGNCAAAVGYITRRNIIPRPEPAFTPTVSGLARSLRVIP